MRNMRTIDRLVYGLVVILCLLVVALSVSAPKKMMEVHSVYQGF